MQPDDEADPEHETARGLGHAQFGGHFLRHGQVPLAAELERLQLDRNRLAMLLAGAETDLAQGKASHRPNLAVVKPL